MRMDTSTEDYVKDRVDRIELSYERITSNPEFTESQMKEERNRMLTWHIFRTLNDQKSQIKFVLTRKAPEIANIVSLILTSFKMRLLENKSLQRNGE
jgi:hypothetical protein